MEGPMTVAVGTSNPIKVRAVYRVFKRYMDPVVEGVSVDSGVPAQPVGFSEVVRGAVNRALRALEAAKPAYGVGVEAGPLKLAGGRGLEVQVAVIVDSGMRAGIGFSSGFLLPSVVEDRVLAGEELSSVFPHQRLGDIGEGVGVIGVLTWGGVTRLDLTMQAVEMALVPLVNPGLYKPLSIDELEEISRATDL